MKRFARIFLGLVGLISFTALAGCVEGGRFAGLRSCSADGSVVWWEFPNQTGSYEGLNNNAQNCGPRA
jgi:hypothetical protein